jgi:hypothetical protein
MPFKKVILFIVTIGCNYFILFAQKQNKLVRLKGIAVNFNNQIQIVDFSETANFSLPNLDRTFVTDSAGYFSISFKIDKPNYFRMGRNVLFLSPGDSLDVYIDYNYAKKAIFKG